MASDCGQAAPSPSTTPAVQPRNAPHALMHSQPKEHALWAALRRQKSFSFESFRSSPDWWRGSKPIKTFRAAYRKRLPPPTSRISVIKFLLVLVVVLVRRPRPSPVADPPSSVLRPPSSVGCLLKPMTDSRFKNVRDVSTRFFKEEPIADRRYSPAPFPPTDHTEPASLPRQRAR